MYKEIEVEGTKFLVRADEYPGCVNDLERLKKYKDLVSFYQTPNTCQEKSGTIEKEARN